MKMKMKTWEWLYKISVIVLECLGSLRKPTENIRRIFSSIFTSTAMALGRARHVYQLHS